MLDALWRPVDNLRAGRMLEKSQHRVALDDVPSALFIYWQRNAALEFAGVPTSKVFFAQALDGLLDFFACVQASGRPCALPSAAADSVWHAWAARAPASLERFCIKHFGREIPHIEEADMRAQMETALVTCMVEARTLEGRDPVTPSVPRLFALDRRLRMPRGYAYDLLHGAVTVQRLDANGVPHGGRRFLNGLDGVQLLAAGLIPQYVYDAHLRAKPDSGAGCGSSANFSSSDCSAVACDSAGGDAGGGDGGGGGCGGGCGGA